MQICCYDDTSLITTGPERPFITLAEEDTAALRDACIKAGTPEVFFSKRAVPHEPNAEYPPYDQGKKDLPI